MKYLVFTLLLFANYALSQTCETFKAESKSVNARCYNGNGAVLLTKVEGGSGYGTYI